MNGAAAAASEAKLAVLSELIDRFGLAARLGKQFGEKRDIYQVCGYRKRLRFDDFMERYERQDIAGRIVDAPATATWREVPEVYEDTGTEDETAFETAWKALAERLKVRHYFERADKLAGIGRYSVLLIGLKGQTNLEQPAASVRAPEDVIYLSPFSEKSARIVEFDEDVGSERNGLPLFYELDLSVTASGGVRRSAANRRRVHFSRVLHVAEGLLEDEVYGMPRLQRVYNLLDDLLKIVGGSGEMYWQGALRGLVAKLEKGFSLPPDQAKALKDEIEEYVHGLTRFIKTVGVDVNALPSVTPDPRGAFEVALSLVSGCTGIPKRVLIGSERGELASDQDEKNWKDRVMERQKNFAEPLVLLQFIGMMIDLGALPKPGKTLKVEWPNLLSLSEKEQAEVANTKAQAMATYSNSSAPEFFPPEETRKHVFGLEEEPEGGFPVAREDAGDTGAGGSDPQQQAA